MSRANGRVRADALQDVIEHCRKVEKRFGKHAHEDVTLILALAERASADYRLARVPVRR